MNKSSDAHRQQKHIRILFTPCNFIYIRYYLLQLLTQGIVDHPQRFTFPTFLLVQLQGILMVTCPLQQSISLFQPLQLLLVLLVDSLLFLDHRFFSRLFLHPLLFDFGDVVPDDLIFALEINQSLIILLYTFRTHHILQIKRCGFDLHFPLMNRILHPLS